MENLDLIAYTSVVAVSFAIFIILTFKEFSYMNKNKFKSKSTIATKSDSLPVE